MSKCLLVIKLTLVAAWHDSEPQLDSISDYPGCVELVDHKTKFMEYGSDLSFFLIHFLSVFTWKEKHFCGGHQDTEACV